MQFYCTVQLICILQVNELNAEIEMGAFRKAIPVVDKVSVPHEPVSIESEFRALDQKVLHLMRQLDIRSTPGWMNLIACAQRAGLTLRDIAESVPCSVSTISRWQSGKAAPPVFMRSPLRDMLVKLVETHLANEARRAA